MTWRQVRLVLAPKPGISDNTEVKAYHSISLSSFLSKTEKLVDRHIRDGVLGECLLRCQKQNAYQTGKSMETTLIKLVMHSASAIEHKLSLIYRELPT
jgi:hypothetical protein